VRENSGGIYTGIGGVTQKGTPLEVATQVMQSRVRWSSAV